MLVHKAKSKSKKDINKAEMQTFMKWQKTPKEKVRNKL